MDPDHTPAPTSPDSSAPGLVREHDAGMPASDGLGGDARVIRARFPGTPGSVLAEAKASTVVLPYELVFRRVIDLPVVIVWDAVSDADMVSGWLAEATIDAREGGEFWFEWMTAPDRSLVTAAGGRITRFEEGELIEYSFFHEGECTAVFHLRLVDIPGGARGRQTELTVTLTGNIPAGIANVLKASWRLHLDLLEDLVHGRPADWERSDVEHGPIWRRYLAELDSAEH